MREGSALGNAGKVVGRRDVAQWKFLWRYVILGVLLAPIVAVLAVSTVVIIYGVQ